jgi:hypothetical protein
MKWRVRISIGRSLERVESAQVAGERSLARTAPGRQESVSVQNHPAM